MKNLALLQQNGAGNNKLQGMHQFGGLISVMSCLPNLAQITKCVYLKMPGKAKPQRQKKWAQAILTEKWMERAIEIYREEQANPNPRGLNKICPKLKWNVFGHPKRQ